MKKQVLTFCLSVLSLHGFSQSPSWAPLTTEGAAQERHENALVLVGEKLILLGGRGLKKLDILHLSEQKWTQGAQPPLEIHHFQAVQLDGLVYVLGALTGGWPNETPLGHILIYDPLEDVWAIGPKIPQERQRGAAGVVVHNSKIYMVNGIINGHSSGWVNWFDEYDPYTDTWKRLPNSPNARDHFQAVVAGDILVVAGGRRSGSVENDGFGGTVAPTDVFDFHTGQWTTQADIPTPRAGTAVALFNGLPVVLGGESDSQEAAHNEVELFDLSSGTWKSLPPMHTGRHGTQAISQNNIIIIGAGSAHRGGGPELKEFELFSQGFTVADLKTNAIKKGELSASTSEIIFGPQDSLKELRIVNTNGNQAQLITSLQLDTEEDFEIDVSREPPFLLPPNGSFSISIRSKERQGSGSATLFVKPMGKAAPLEIRVEGRGL